MFFPRSLYLIFHTYQFYLKQLTLTINQNHATSPTLYKSYTPAASCVIVLVLWCNPAWYFGKIWWLQNNETNGDPLLNDVNSMDNYEDVNDNHYWESINHYLRSPEDMVHAYHNIIADNHNQAHLNHTCHWMTWPMHNINQDWLGCWLGEPLSWAWASDGFWWSYSMACGFHNLYCTAVIWLLQ